MPTIVFWNIQRGSGDIMSEATDNLHVVLLSICEIHKPDIMILCEGQNNVLENMQIWGKLPRNYTLAKPAGTYKKQTTLQYAILARSEVNVTHADLECADGYPRPALFVRFDSGSKCYAIAAIHTVSITNSQTRQMAQSTEIYEYAPKSTDYQMLDAIIGDMNMDASDPKILGSIVSKQSQHFLQDFEMKAPSQKTHTRNGGKSYDKTLDWAWVRYGKNSTISVISGKQDKDSKRDDADFEPYEDPASKSDHLPIKLIW
jgi:hypothetical protein